MSKDVAAVILAGGAGRRIGGAKPLRRLRGERLIDCAVRQARGWSDTVAIAVRENSQVQPLDTGLVHDEPGVAGPLGALIAGLRFARTEERSLLLTIPADTPFLPADLLERLLEAISGHDCALAASGGQLHPVCGLWRISLLKQVPDYLSTGRRSLKGFAELAGLVAVEWPGGPSDPFLNINTAEDLVRAERRAAS
jgi:molybdopterin-guanine dinucleotide biosynthesis protein A